jgi:hypothetical protein
MKPRRQRTPAELFALHVTPGAPDECWEWRGTRNDSGYGVMVVGGRNGRKQIRAHRVAWELHHKHPLNNAVVMHTCDNPACCNPAHLRAGTQQDNLADMVNKRRHRSRALSGEANGHAKLTTEAVRQIRIVYRAGGITQQQLADRFGVGTTAISSVVRGQTWKEVA